MKQIALLLLVSSLLFVGFDLTPVKTGDAAPAFTLKNYDGKEYSLPALLKSNKLVVVMFISTQCPVSNGYNDRMVSLAKGYGAKGVMFVGINANVKESVSEIAAHSKEHGFPFPVLKDEGNKIADAYGAQVTPETYVISPDGTVRYHGRIDDSRAAEKVQTRDLALALDAALAGKEPPRTETKAVGCSIKRVSQ